MCGKKSGTIARMWRLVNPSLVTYAVRTNIACSDLKCIWNKYNLFNV